MKKSAVAVLLIVTLLFVAFVAGFYVGRSSNSGSVQISGIPKFTFPAPATSSTPTQTTVPATLDAETIRVLAAINAATLEELDQVPNVGQVTAKAILDYRNAYGQFQRPEDLMRVTGVGEKTLQNILDYFRGRLSDNENPGS
jgi:competence ComEA-like helix-hairpin-helix protein